MILSVSEGTFSSEVEEASTPVLVYFWAPWCGICRLIPPALNKFQAQWGTGMKMVGINADRSLKLANAYRLRTLPTLLLFEGGQVRHRIEGFHSAEDLRRQLEALVIGQTASTSISLVTAAESSEPAAMI
ncbi:MAG: thioredoxin family protein [Hormoscilla sp.]